MIKKKKLHIGDIVMLRNGRLGFISSLSPCTVSIEKTSISTYNNSMCEENCFSDVDIIAIYYLHNHSDKEIGQKYKTMAGNIDDGEWDEESL